MTHAGTVVRQVFVWLSRVCLWIILAVLAVGLFQFVYFSADNRSLLGCRFTVDVLFYFVCSERIADYLFNVPLLFLYAAASTVLGLPPSPTFALLVYALDVIVVLALFRLLYLLLKVAKRLAAPKQHRT